MSSNVAIPQDEEAPGSLASPVSPGPKPPMPLVTVQHEHGNEMMNRTMGVVMAFMIPMVCFLCCAGIACIGLAIWLIVTFVKYMQDGGQTCDYPLKIWCIVYWSVGVGSGCLMSCSKLFCCYFPKKDANELPPLRVNLCQLPLMGFCLAWCAVGVNWSTSSTGSPTSCSSVCPELVKAILINASMALTVWIPTATAFLIIITVQTLNLLCGGMKYQPS